MYFKWIFKSYY